MNVYVIEAFEYESSEIIKIFKDKEMAEQFFATYKKLIKLKNSIDSLYNQFERIHFKTHEGDTSKVGIEFINSKIYKELETAEKGLKNAFKLSKVPYAYAGVELTTKKIEEEIWKTK